MSDFGEEQERPGGVTPRMALLVLGATLLVMVILYELINWKPTTSSAGSLARPSYGAHL